MSLQMIATLALLMVAVVWAAPTRQVATFGTKGLNDRSLSSATTQLKLDYHPAYFNYILRKQEVHYVEITDLRGNIESGEITVSSDGDGGTIIKTKLTGITPDAEIKYAVDFWGTK